MRELILVVDDEPFVLNVVCNILRNAGFAVVSAASAVEAMEVGGRHTGQIHLLLSDVIMPGLNGPALAERFAEIHPETECLFMAGLPDTADVCEFIHNRGRAFLPKPFGSQALVSKVRQVLAASGGGPLAAA